MNIKDHELISHAIWQAGFIPDKNKIRQSAKYQITKLIATNLASALKNDNPEFDWDKFMQECRI